MALVMVLQWMNMTENNPEMSENESWKWYFNVWNLTIIDGLTLKCELST